jgi:N-acetylglutamate synthase-like GNAT family acetyltransferase
MRFDVNPPVSNDALNSLFARTWPAHKTSDFGSVLKHALVYVCAFEEDRLIGCVKVAWDDGIHGFLLDPTVDPAFQRRGIGLRLVGMAAEEAKKQGIEWLHVDYEPSLKQFYQSCGFRHTEAGLVNLLRS